MIQNPILCKFLNEYILTLDEFNLAFDIYGDFQTWLREKDPNYIITERELRRAGKDLIKVYHNHRRMNDTWRRFTN